MIEGLLELSRAGTPIGAPEQLSLTDLASSAALIVQGDATRLGVEVSVVPGQPNAVGGSASLNGIRPEPSRPAPVRSGRSLRAIRSVCGKSMRQARRWGPAEGRLQPRDTVSRTRVGLPPAANRPESPVSMRNMWRGPGSSSIGLAPTDAAVAGAFVASSHSICRLEFEGAGAMATTLWAIPRIERTIKAVRNRLIRFLRGLCDPCHTDCVMLCIGHIKSGLYPLAPAIRLRAPLPDRQPEDPVGPARFRETIRVLGRVKALRRRVDNGTRRNA